MKSKEIKIFANSQNCSNINRQKGYEDAKKLMKRYYKVMEVLKDK